MNPEVSHSIKHRKEANDEFYTPKELCRFLIDMVDLKVDDVVLDSAYGTGNFYNQYPGYTINKHTMDFFNFNEKIDWIITNPPYSKIDDYLKQSAKICRKGFAYLLGINNLTAKRIKEMEDNGFYITKVHICKVFKWFGMSMFVVFEKDKQKGIISFDRRVWK